MEEGAIFKVRFKDKELMMAAFTAIDLRKSKARSYTYNDVNTLVTEIERVLAEQLLKDSIDRMKGLLSKTQNTLTKYIANISIKIKQKDVLADLKATAECLFVCTGMIILPEITTNTYNQEETDRLITYQLAAIRVKEGNQQA
jgi:hypothetical protein